MSSKSSGWIIDRVSATGVPDNVVADEVAPAHMQATKPSNLVDISGVSRMRIRFFGGDADGETNVCSIYLVDKDTDNASGEEAREFYTSILLCSVALTYSTQVGLAGFKLNELNFFADTITLTDGLTTALDGSRMGSNTASYVPVNLASELVIADFGAAQWLLFSHNLGTANSANCMYRKITDGC